MFRRWGCRYRILFVNVFITRIRDAEVVIIRLGDCVTAGYQYQILLGWHGHSKTVWCSGCHRQAVWLHDCGLSMSHFVKMTLPFFRVIIRFRDIESWSWVTSNFVMLRFWCCDVDFTSVCVMLRLSPPDGEVYRVSFFTRPVLTIPAGEPGAGLEPPVIVIKTSENICLGQNYTHTNISAPTIIGYH